MNEYKDFKSNRSRPDLSRFLKLAIERRERSVVKIDGYRRAAVVAPIVVTEQGWELLFTVRSKRMSNHAGQVSFPGGRVELDETLQEAAVRETIEEIGVQPEWITGAIDDHASPAGYVVTPFIGFLKWPSKLILNPAEVDSVFTVPIAEFVKIKPRVEIRTDRGLKRTLHYFDCKDRLIWGLTANIVKNLLQIIGE